nr:cadherin-15-like [Aotus nancymaae]
MDAALLLVLGLLAQTYQPPAATSSKSACPHVPAPAGTEVLLKPVGAGGTGGIPLTRAQSALPPLPESLCVSLGAPGWRKPSTLYPWRRVPAPSRVRRAWVIPPISVSENHKRLPYPLVQIKSDKQQLGSVIYSIQGPGVDEEPRGVFSIDKFTGKVFLNAMLDREKTDRFRLRAFALDLGGSTLEDPTDLEIVVVDQNDNRPAFLQEAFTGRVLEGAAPGEAGAQPQPGRAAGKSSAKPEVQDFP